MKHQPVEVPLGHQFGALGFMSEHQQNEPLASVGEADMSRTKRKPQLSRFQEHCGPDSQRFYPL